MKQVFGVKPQISNHRYLMVKPAANVNEVTFQTKILTRCNFLFFNFGATFSLKKQDQLQDFFLKNILSIVTGYRMNT